MGVSWGCCAAGGASGASGAPPSTLPSGAGRRRTSPGDTATLLDYDRAFPDSPSSGVLTVAQVNVLARAVCETHFSRGPGGEEVDPAWVCAVCEVESGRRCNAERWEPHLGDSSVGLMQTLVETARFCHDSLGRREYGRPDSDSLRRPTVSIYFGAAYLAYLRSYGGVRRSEAWVIRAYNGGPGGADKDYTRAYLDKYLLAKQGLSRGRKAGRGQAGRGRDGDAKRHVVVLAGDTLSGIAEAHGMTLAQLLSLEGNSRYRQDPDLIHVGDVVLLE